MKQLFLLKVCISGCYKIADSSIKLTALLWMLLFTFAASAQTPIKLLPTGYGPEDMVIDSMSNPPRLLISCASRRTEYPKYGEIESMDPAKGTRQIIKRIGEPAGLVFRPHGISLVKAGEIQYLYVISHNDAKGEHPVLRYQIDDDTLVFVEELTSRLLVSPNALQAYPDGSVVVCNDAAVRGDLKETIFRQKKGNILFYDGRGNWSIMANKIGMPAGLAGIGKNIYVSATTENKLYSFELNDGQLKNKSLLAEVTGPDNIRFHDGKLLTTSHSKSMKFVAHVKNRNHKSPSLVLSIDTQTGKSTRLFYDNGKIISAASVALIFNHQLIIGQIFEPFIGISVQNIGK